MNRTCLLVLAAAPLLGAVEAPAPRPASPAADLGYLGQGDLIDTSPFLRPPPARGSLDARRDVAASKAALLQHGKARWALAASDADLYTPRMTSAFSCAVGFEISPAATPKLHALLLKAGPALGYSVTSVKKTYQRPRPFMVNHQPQCEPGLDKVLREDGSYPSGHAAVGFGWGLILAQLVPERASQAVARGRAFADSRRYCNVHWLSDTEAGMIAGAAALAHLQSRPAFQADLTAVREELAANSVKSRKPTRDCAAEARALQIDGITPTDRGKWHGRRAQAPAADNRRSAMDQ